MDSHTIGWRLAECVAPVALACVAYLSVAAAALYRARARREHEARLQVRIELAVIAAVQAVQQLMVDRLKASSRERQLTTDQQRELRQTALDCAKLQLGPRALVDIEDTLGLAPGAVEKLLVTWTEAAVHRLARERWVVLDAGTAGAAVPFAA